mmetsp:Transcript_11913/g.30029  ORF Transcript_11913/g.30029 Transcript_11913/m.30029 type:complete len:255 (+) Transcript_11913:2200-2964(+)
MQQREQLGASHQAGGCRGVALGQGCQQAQRGRHTGTLQRCRPARVAPPAAAAAAPARWQRGLRSGNRADHWRGRAGRHRLPGVLLGAFYGHCVAHCSAALQLLTALAWGSVRVRRECGQQVVSGRRGDATLEHQAPEAGAALLLPRQLLRQLQEAVELAVLLAAVAHDAVQLLKVQRCREAVQERGLRGGVVRRQERHNACQDVGQLAMPRLYQTSEALRELVQEHRGVHRLHARRPCRDVTLLRQESRALPVA